MADRRRLPPARTTSFYSWAGAATTLALIGLLAHVRGAFDVAVGSTAVSYLALYTGARRSTRFTGALWLANPVRITVPLFLVFQLLHWAKCAAAQSFPYILGWPIVPSGYSPQSSAPACSEYLLLHWPYFLLLLLTFRNFAQLSSATKSLPWLTLIVGGGVVLGVACIGFLFTYLQPASIMSRYVVSNAMKFTALIWMVTTAIALGGGQYRIVAYTMLGSSMLVGIAVVSATTMRFLVLEQAAAMLIVFVSLQRRFGVAALLKLCAAVSLTALVFTVSTDLKRVGEVRTREHGGRAVVEKVDEFVTRSSSYHADAVARERSAIRNLFVEHRALIIWEIASGIPFSGFIQKVLDPRGGDSDYSFDMHFYRTFALRPIHDVSYFVSGPTAVKGAFGPVAAVALLCLAGLLHGRVCAWASSAGGPIGWILPQAAMLPIALHGFRKSDFLRVAVSLVLYVVFLRVANTVAATGSRGRLLRDEAGKCSVAARVSSL